MSVLMASQLTSISWSLPSMPSYRSVANISAVSTIFFSNLLVGSSACWVRKKFLAVSATCSHLRAGFS